MGGLTGILIVYILGGITFLPLIIVVIFLHGYFTFPTRESTAYGDDETSTIIRPGDDTDAINHAQNTLGEKFQLRNNHEAEVAAGYFAVTREYTPGGINAAPPERSTPIGSTTVSAPSQSVYQSMYKSIFERKPHASPLDNKGAGKQQRRGGNVFYVVLRHGHLMLYDDEEQLDVRHVVSLAHHNVSIFGGGDYIPEGELFIKRNALRLSRRTEIEGVTTDGGSSKPFYLFSENCSEKEDFYFALLRNQGREPGAKDNPPVPLQYDVKDIITLVQRLHSSEEHLQTRWINAIIGRAFLSLYKTPEVENFIRSKITKKISRVKTPSFLSKIVLRHIDMGEAAPVITNPRLKDLTVDGELIVEADVRYTGNFRIEVAATARIDLGTRFKAREVELLLAVVLKRIEGHAMVRIKPPPSNRLWMTFASMPKIDMTIEPIVSSRQITYTLILRQIENRIKEVFAESLVFPNWDDSPFHNTEHKKWRGGIWADDVSTPPSDPESAAAQAGDVEGVHHLEAEHEEAMPDLPQMEKSASMPLPEGQSPLAGGVFSRKGGKAASNTGNLGNSNMNGSSSSIDTGTSERPRALRSGSFVTASSPIVATDIINADAFKDNGSSTHPHIGSAMASMSALSQTNSPVPTPVGSPSRPSEIEKRGSQSSASSRNSANLEKGTDNDTTPQPSPNNSELNSDIISNSYPSSPTSITNTSFRADPPSMKSFGSFGRDPRRENSASSSGKSSTVEAKRISLAVVSNAAATAKKWGLNALQRHGEPKADGSLEAKEAPTRPLVMGRGQPLPPPGTPLPPPDKKTKTAPIPVPKRKPIPSPSESQTQLDSGQSSNGNESKDIQRPVAPYPPLPKRRSRESQTNESSDDGLLVVAAPANDSEPTTPMSEHAPEYMPPWVDDPEDLEPPQEQPPADQKPPRLPKRRAVNRVLSSSPDEDGPRLPTWQAAQEEEARAKSSFIDEDMGV